MPRTRRYDPERRDRILEAALRVAREGGIAGITHRTVAAEADVPLGSTTYHFGSLDELLVAALRKANESFGRVLADGLGATGPGATGPGEGLAATLARLLGEWLGGERARVELEYELYLAALRRPALRPVAAEWADTVTAVLAPRTDPVTARAVVALMDGVCLQVLLTDGVYDEEFARETLARVLKEETEPAGGTSSEAPTRSTGT
ncbi:TetR/AcrR family transcriptional regulator [Streptomyces sp. NPDC056144]|uniref:TetR/AcrR family transcriptional regulator n=1 Tax=unclassified Streptomyces TaxID=2593676 RepID=UPI0035DB8659